MKQRGRPDDLQTISNGSHRRRRHCARQLGDLDIEAAEAALKHLHMLTDKHRGRRNHRNLLACKCRDCCGPERHFRLAEPNITANQAIHPAARSKILESVTDCL
jgi:hypothetical protein